MQIVIDILPHETTTFTPVTTTKSNFYDHFDNLQTQQMIDPCAGTNRRWAGLSTTHTLTGLNGSPRLPSTYIPADQCHDRYLIESSTACLNESTELVPKKMHHIGAIPPTIFAPPPNRRPPDSGGL